GPEGRRQPAAGGVAKGARVVPAEREAARALHPPPRQRPHRGHAPRLPDALGHDRRERPRPRPAGRGDQQEPVLEGVGGVRPRGRLAERPRPRGRPPVGGDRGPPPRPAGGGGQHALHPLGAGPPRGAPPPPSPPAPRSPRRAPRRRLPPTPPPPGA